MKADQQQALLQLIGVAGAILASTWVGGSKLATIEAKLEAIPALTAEVKELGRTVASQDTSIQLIQHDVTDLKKPLANTQANVRGLIKQVSNLNTGPVVERPHSFGPFTMNGH